MKLITLHDTYSLQALCGESLDVILISSCVSVTTLKLFRKHSNVINLSVLRLKPFITRLPLRSRNIIYEIYNITETAIICLWRCQLIGSLKESFVRSSWFICQKSPCWFNCGFPPFLKPFFPWLNKLIWVCFFTKGWRAYLLSIREIWVVKLFINGKQIRLLNGKTNDFDWYYSVHHQRLKWLVHNWSFPQTPKIRDVPHYVFEFESLLMSHGYFLHTRHFLLHTACFGLHTGHFCFPAQTMTQKATLSNCNLYFPYLDIQKEIKWKTYMHIS